MIQLQFCAFLTLYHFHNVLLQLVRDNALELYDFIRLLLLIAMNNTMC